MNWTGERKCFKFSDGTQDIYGDPMEIIERMNSFSGGDPERIRAAAYPAPEPLFDEIADPHGAPEPIQQPRFRTIKDPKTGEETFEQAFFYPEAPFEAKEKFRHMIAYAFGVQLFDRKTGQGFTWGMLGQLWNMFHEWLNEKKERPASLPTSSAPTEEESLPV